MRDDPFANCDVGRMYRYARQTRSDNYKPLSEAYNPERDVLKPACFVAFVIVAALVMAGVI